MLHVVEKLSKEAVARQFKVDTKNIRYWFQHKECLVENKKRKGLCKQRRLEPITNDQVQ